MGRRKKEIWKYIKIPNIKQEYYLISNWGRIKNIKDKFISFYTDKDGYQKCTLTKDNGGKKHFFVHRLVAIHFIPNPENKEQVNHLCPNNKKNLYYKNLEWSTAHENREHSKKYHLQETLSCSAHGMATLTNEDVHKICKLMEQGYKNSQICDIFGFDKSEPKRRERFRSVIKHIRKRNTWLPISKYYNF